jgi:hypothetical protein
MPGHICDTPCSQPNNGGQFKDWQVVPAEQSFRILREWKVGTESVQVFDPETKKAYNYEVNTNDANSNPPIRTEYTNTPPF